jgi:hypothetical protein
VSLSLTLRSAVIAMDIIFFRDKPTAATVAGKKAE